MLDEIKDIFVGMGFEILEGPRGRGRAEYNFTKLNIEEGHPAREWTRHVLLRPRTARILLRTQTSPMQIRAMETQRAAHPHSSAPGRVYRKDEVDATHSPMFHQIEGMAIDKGITMADLKGTLERRSCASSTARTPSRASARITSRSPSRAARWTCSATSATAGKGCPTCKGEGWIEVLGAGMIHPKVLEGCGIDSHGLLRLGLRHGP